MSVEAMHARIAELSQLTGRVQNVARPAPAPSAVGSFDAVLAAQTGTAPATLQGLPGAAPAAGSGEAQYGPLVDEAARRHGLDPALLRALVKQESGFDPNARSHAGAVGLGQLMPGTAAGLGVTDPTDPAQSADGAARYLKAQLQTFGGDVTRALAAYNAGPGAVQRFGGVPPYAETRAYVQKVTASADQYRSGGIR